MRHHERHQQQENYSVVNDQEVQSNHWSHEQVTLFIAIVHYLEPAAEAQIPVMRREAHIVVSPDRKHDSAFVQHFLKALLEDFKLRKLNFSLYINSDGARKYCI